MTGMGAITTATQPRRVPAQFIPSALNCGHAIVLASAGKAEGAVGGWRRLTMYWEKSGNPAPAMERSMVLAATAEAALNVEGK